MLTMESSLRFLQAIDWSLGTGTIYHGTESSLVGLDDGGYDRRWTWGVFYTVVSYR